MDITRRKSGGDSDVSGICSIVVALLVVVVGFTLVLSKAFHVVPDTAVEVLFVCMYGVSGFGMVWMFLLHACGQLTGIPMTTGGKKDTFTRSGIFVLGSGGMIYQSFNLYGLIVTYERCPDVAELSLTVASLFVSGLQVYFLVKFQKLVVDKSALVVAFSRLVLMHTAATNICVWIYTIVIESSLELEDVEEVADPVATSFSDNSTDFADHFNRSTSTVLVCGKRDTLTTLIVPYTFPLLIEFCVLASGLCFSMWESCHLPITKDTQSSETITEREETESNGVEDSKAQMVLIEHNNEGEGMFLGWLVMVGTIVFIIGALYESYAAPLYKISFGDVVYGFNLGLSGMALLAVLFTAYRMSALTRRRDLGKGHRQREQTVLIVTYIAMVLYKGFCVIAGIDNDNPMITTDGVLSAISGLGQAIFINCYASHRVLAYAEQRQVKPGRQGLEFLRWVNLALWLVNTFLLKTTQAKHPLELTFGVTVWAILSNIVQPLTILFYFSSTMLISDIIAHNYTWHNARANRNASAHVYRVACSSRVSTIEADDRTTF